MGESGRVSIQSEREIHVLVDDGCFRRLTQTNQSTVENRNVPK